MAKNADISSDRVLPYDLAAATSRNRRRDRRRGPRVTIASRIMERARRLFGRNRPVIGSSHRIASHRLDDMRDADLAERCLKSKLRTDDRERYANTNSIRFRWTALASRASPWRAAAGAVRTNKSDRI